MKIYLFIYKCKCFDDNVTYAGVSNRRLIKNKKEHAKRNNLKKQFKCRVCDKDFAQKQAMKSRVFTVNNLHLDSRMF